MRAVLKEFIKKNDRSFERWELILKASKLIMNKKEKKTRKIGHIWASF